MLNGFVWSGDTGTVTLVNLLHIDLDDRAAAPGLPGSGVVRSVHGCFRDTEEGARQRLSGRHLHPAADSRTRYSSAVRSRTPGTTIIPGVTVPSLDQPGVEPENSE
jgi:hypothetical protein